MDLRVDLVQQPVLDDIPRLRHRNLQRRHPGSADGGSPRRHLYCAFRLVDVSASERVSGSEVNGYTAKHGLPSHLRVSVRGWDVLE